jgi:RNA polymerase sigma-70 factor (ECF subfamily)
MLNARITEKITNSQGKNLNGQKIDAWAFCPNRLTRPAFQQPAKFPVQSCDTRCAELDPASSLELTELLREWNGGDQKALVRIVELAYPELRKIARRCLRRERPEHTIQATALVHEAYLRLFDTTQVRWQDRLHFFAIIAKVMRRILIEYARAQGCSKRGGGRRRVDLDEALMISAESDPEIVRLDEALGELAKFDSRKAQVVEMRYFGGLTSDEVASVLGISPQSVNRDWSLAKAWLLREMTRQERNGGSPPEPLQS